MSFDYRELHHFERRLLSAQLRAFSEEIRNVPGNRRQLGITFDMESQTVTATASWEMPQGVYRSQSYRFDLLDLTRNVTMTLPAMLSILTGKIPK